MHYDNQQYERDRESDSLAALIDLCGGSRRTWVTLTKKDGSREVKILPQHVANTLLENLAAGCNPMVKSAKMQIL